MANEPAGPGAGFRLNPSQMAALKLIEQQQNQLVLAANLCANLCADASIGEAAAAKLLIEAARVMDASKLEWLKATQRVVTLAAAPVIPDLAGLPARVKANGGSIGG